jgi:biotin transport system substrate-specific component
LQKAVKIGDILTKGNPWSLVGPYNKSLLESLVPSATFVHKLAISLVFVAILALLGRARFYLPEIPVPITLQTLGVLASGGILGLRWGMFTVLVWYFLGMAGVPVFQGGSNGWAYVSGGSPTGGYLIGFIAATWLVAYLSQHGWTRGRGLWPMLLGNLLIYLPGLIWLGAFNIVSWNRIYSVGMHPFIAGDLVKLICAALIVSGLWVVADHRKS